MNTHRHLDHTKVQAHYVAYLREKLAELPRQRISDTFPGTREEWETHTARLRPSLRTVFDFPETSGPLSPRTVGKIERDDFTIEKVIYDAEPGSLCTRSPLPAKRRNLSSPSPHLSQRPRREQKRVLQPLRGPDLRQSGHHLPHPRPGGRRGTGRRKPPGNTRSPSGL